MADETITGDGPWTITVRYSEQVAYSNTFTDRDEAEGALAVAQAIHTVTRVEVS